MWRRVGGAEASRGHGKGAPERRVLSRGVYPKVRDLASVQRRGAPGRRVVAQHSQAERGANTCLAARLSVERARTVSHSCPRRRPSTLYAWRFLAVVVPMDRVGNSGGADGPMLGLWWAADMGALDATTPAWLMRPRAQELKSKLINDIDMAYRLYCSNASMAMSVAVAATVGGRMQRAKPITSTGCSVLDSGRLLWRCQTFHHDCVQLERGCAVNGATRQC